jgi:GT2 family glycosyltransferase
VIRAGIVVPTLGNRRELMAECLRSISDQGHTQPDLVVVTTPDAMARVERYAAGAQVIPQDGPGIAAAITTGWQFLGTRVDALAWLGDDDRLAAGSLLRALTELQRRPAADMVYGQARYIDAAGQPTATLRPGRMGALLLRLGRNMIAQPGCLYRRSAVERIGGLDHTLRLAFDVDLHRRLIANGRARYIPAVLGEPRTHPGSLTVREREDSVKEADLALTRCMPGLLRRSRPLWSPLADVTLRATARIGSR